MPGQVSGLALHKDGVWLAASSYVENPNDTSIELAAQADQLQASISYFRIGASDETYQPAPKAPARPAPAKVKKPAAKTVVKASAATAKGFAIDMDADDSEFQRY